MLVVVVIVALNVVKRAERLICSAVSAAGSFSANKCHVEEKEIKVSERGVKRQIITCKHDPWMCEKKREDGNL